LVAHTCVLSSVAAVIFSVDAVKEAAAFNITSPVCRWHHGGNVIAEKRVMDFEI
jgi:hypothetical protein